MWTYEKRLQFPVNIKTACPKTAQLIISQFGGPDGELAASMRYLSQRYSMPCRKISGLLTDIGTEELAHLEIICSIIFQLTRNMKPEDARTAGFDAYYIDHTAALWPQSAGGVPFNACEFQSKGDAITDEDTCQSGTESPDHLRQSVACHRGSGRKSSSPVSPRQGDCPFPAVW